MAHLADFLTPDDLKQIQNLQVLARTVVEGFCTGIHRSPHKGFSVEFKQHRPYVHGDEIRHLDWRVFGKTDRFYIREYEEETNLRCTLLLDASGSMAYGSESGRSKFQYAQRLAACLTYLMLGQQDSVGLVTFDTKVRRYIPPRGQTSHLKVLVDQLQATKTGGETEIGKVLHDLVPRLQRRGMIVILSDLFGDVQELLSALAHMRFARHEVVVFQIWDPDELEFSFRQWTRFDCLEVDGKKYLVDPNHLRASYLEHLERFRAELKRGCHRHHVDLVPIRTDRPYAEVLAEYLTLRMGR
jgi:uncharacterized protein (DUF58 family)